jgi:hypothetical protein
MHTAKLPVDIQFRWKIKNIAVPQNEPFKIETLTISIF